LLLSEKVRIEIFVPDPPNPIYSELLEELAEELSYAFGGSTRISALGNYRSSAGFIVPDRINILFSDVSLRWERDRLALERYLEWVNRAVERALEREEAVLISVYPVCHGE
jgi:hypothetical protein